VRYTHDAVVRPAESVTRNTALATFLDHYNRRRYHESLRILTLADVDFGRGEATLLRRETIKQETIALRRLQHLKTAA